jgi:heat-inducible transcriptional repressor
VIRLAHTLTKTLAEKTRSLVLSYLKEKEILFKEGWDVLKEPEFKNEKLVSEFLEFLLEFEKKLDEFEIRSEIEVFIGKENPFPRGKEFSLIFSKCCLPKRKEGIFALVGPKRMDYYKNITLLESLKEFLTKF